MLGCMKDACSGRTWEWLFCPNCAAAVDALGKLAPMSAGFGPGAPTADPRRLDEVSKALEDLALQLEAAQPLNPDPALRHYLDECRSAQTELKQLRAAEEAARKEAAARETAAARHPEPVATVSTPELEPLDGVALGLQLVRELGLQPVGAPAPAVAPPVPVQKPPAKPEKKPAAHLDDYERFRKAVQRASGAADEKDYGTLK
jgi:hypothetical protein